jgi:hypothetical protein
MARTTGRSFKDVRKSLYMDLTAHAYIPMVVDIDGGVTKEVDKRFFPAGTAEKVLTPEALTRLFKTIASTQPESVLSLQPAQIAKQVETRKLHVFLAILITSNCDLEALSAFTTKLLAQTQWTNDDGEFVKLPIEDAESLQIILEDSVAADNFLQKQHEFFAAIIEKNKEVKGRFRRLPYVREKLIGQGSFGKIYDVSVR